MRATGAIIIVCQLVRAHSHLEKDAGSLSDLPEVVLLAGRKQLPLRDSPLNPWVLDSFKAPLPWLLPASHLCLDPQEPLSSLPPCSLLVTDGDLCRPLLSMYCTVVSHSQSLSLVKPTVGPRVSVSFSSCRRALCYTQGNCHIGRHPCECQGQQPVLSAPKTGQLFTSLVPVRRVNHWKEQKRGHPLLPGSAGESW